MNHENVLAGLGPAIHEKLHNEPQRHSMAKGWVYFMTNRPNGILYVGVTDDLVRRVWEHREGVVAGFTKRYGLKRLVYFEAYDDIRDAQQRERDIKHYARAWEVRLILLNNPTWNDLYDSIA